jgi:L-seryl-tRNA(Ser) seleniumtransferase
VIAGRADLVARCAEHPLARALRPGSLVLSALQTVALAYLRRDVDAIPFWRMATTPVDALRSRAAALGVGRAVDCASVAGGGTLPGVEIPSAGVSLDGDHLARLRAASPPIIGRVEDGRTILDLRTVDPSDDAHLAAALG